MNMKHFYRLLSCILLAAGAVIGTRAIIVSAFMGIIIAALSGLVIKLISGESKFAFGPYLAIGIAIGTLWGENIADWYINLLTVE